MDSRTSALSGTDHVIGGFAREALSAALAATHRAGFGPQARVLDGARGDIARQVERIGLRAPWAEPPGPDAVLIVVNAPGRTAIVAELFSRLGAEFVLLAARRGAERAAADTVAAMSPDIRIGEGAAADG
jgi:hypothetical protein